MKILTVGFPEFRWPRSFSDSAIQLSQGCEQIFTLENVLDTPTSVWNFDRVRSVWYILLIEDLSLTFLEPKYYGGGQASKPTTEDS